ncbi:MAG TPA: hypothetical protein VFF65_08025 [Phycisphaerales bacterium]|nr:hypothetical protein [Phycisphaerales bacterium]
MKRRGTKYAVGLALLIFGLLTVLQLSELVRAHSSTGNTYRVILHPDGSGGLRERLPDDQGPSVAVACLTWGCSAGPTAGGEPCWEAVTWELDVKPINGTVTPAQRTAIVRAAFGNANPVASPSWNGPPPAGQTVTKGLDRTWHHATTLRWLAQSLLPLLLVSAALGSIAVLFVRSAMKSETLCPECGYDRVGIAPATLCPECGKPL